MPQKKKKRPAKPAARPTLSFAGVPVQGFSDSTAPFTATAPGPGLKYDGGKLRWDLLPLVVIRLIVMVMTFGAAKYAANNWQAVEPERYWGAIFRHLDAARSGEKYDDETGLPHLAHALCCLVFLTWQFLQRNEQQTHDAAERQARSIERAKAMAEARAGFVGGRS